MSRMWVETAVERTSVVVAPARSAEWWAHLVASAITVVGIVVVTAPLLMLPLRSGEAMLRLGLGFLFFICILRLCYQGIWAVAGRERFEVTPSGFTVRATWFGLGRARTYPLGFVTNIRPRDRVSRSTRRGKKRILARTLAFDVAGRTINAAMNLSLAEAAYLASTLEDALETSRREAVRTYRS